MAESHSVFVGNLSDRVRYHDIERFFKDYGKLADVTLKVNYPLVFLNKFSSLFL